MLAGPVIARPGATMPSRSRRKATAQRLQVNGALWVSVDGQDLGGHGRIGLLRAVAENGSITRAAQAFGMSYKAAWDAINTMNELSGQPLVERVTGGRGGGFTQLTPHGLALVERYETVAAVHQRFLQLLDRSAMNLDEEFSLLKVLNVKTSARNQWVGTVSGIRAGAVNDEVELLLAGDVRLVSTITRESTESLGLRLKQTVIALVKSSAVLLATDLAGARFSARNLITGQVTRVTAGTVNAEVTLVSAAGLTVVAIVTQGSVHELGLAPGREVTALIKASDVVLAITT
jgi:molybdate transport system regulatory protein